MYVGPAEIQHLVELTYPETVQPRLLAAVASSLGVPKYCVWARAETAAAYELLRHSGNKVLHPQFAGAQH